MGTKIALKALKLRARQIAGLPRKTEGAATVTYYSPSASSDRVRFFIVDVLSDVDVDLSSLPSTVDSVTLFDGMLIALANQDTGTENGIYLYQDAELTKQNEEGEYYVVAVAGGSYGRSIYNLADGINFELCFATDETIGALGDLDTTEQGSIVGAINELVAALASLASAALIPPVAYTGSEATSVLFSLVNAGNALTASFDKTSGTGNTVLVANSAGGSGIALLVQKLSGNAEALWIDGSVGYTVTSVAANANIQDIDNTILADTAAAAGAFTLTLPAAGAAKIGRVYHVIDYGRQAATKNITIAVSGSDTFIGGATTKTINVNGRMLRIECTSATTWACHIMAEL